MTTITMRASDTRETLADELAGYELRRPNRARQHCDYSPRRLDASSQRAMAAASLLRGIEYRSDER